MDRITKICTQTRKALHRNGRFQNVPMIPIHIINLEHRADRRKKVIRELAVRKINEYRFVTAINGKTLDIDQMEKDGSISYLHRKLRAGEYGCYLSHLGIYQEILNRPEKMHFILEDDVYFPRDFDKIFEQTMDKIRDVEWDVFYAGINPNDNHLEGTYIDDNLYYPKHILWGTHAYVIKKTTVEKIIDRLLPIILPIDTMLMHLEDLKRLVMVKPIVKVRFTDSDTNPSPTDPEPILDQNGPSS